MLIPTTRKLPALPGTWTERVTAGWAAATAASLAWILLTPVSGAWVSPNTIWTIEPAAYVGAAAALLSAAMTMAGLEKLRRKERQKQAASTEVERRWEHLTEEFLRVFDHDLGRPMRRIYGKERALEAILRASGHQPIGAVTELMEEIERQVPNYRLMLQNVQAMVNLEETDAVRVVIPTDIEAVVENASTRYAGVARDIGKALGWVSENDEPHMISTNPNAVEHILANLADNAVKHAKSQIAITVNNTPEGVTIEVADDGPGINPNHVEYIFERSWTPEVARREEKESSGLGLHIARSMARRYGGDVALTCAGGTGDDEWTTFAMTLPNLRE